MMHPIKFHQKKVGILVFSVSVVLIFGWYLKTIPLERSPKRVETSIGQDISVDIPVDYFEFKKIPTSQNFVKNLTGFEKCPLCFGRDLCDDISAGFIVSHGDIIEVSPRGRIIYDGYLGTTDKVRLISPSEKLTSRLDEFVCINSTGTKECNSQKNYKNSVLANPDIISLSFLTTSYKFQQWQPEDTLITLCSSPHLKNVLEKSYDEDDNGLITQDEKVKLFSSLVTSPEHVFIQFCAEESISLPSMNFLGSCGRVYVTDGDVTLLKGYIDEPFVTRAGIAMQILNIIDDFQEGESDWLIIHFNLTFENIALTKSNDVVLLDYSDVLIVDKNYFQVPSIDASLDFDASTPCNNECFQKFVTQLTDFGKRSTDVSINDQACRKAHKISSHIMYASVCQYIFGNDNSAMDKSSSLLHSPPDPDKHMLLDLLRDCSEEKVGGSRLQAVEDLKDYLNDLLEGIKMTKFQDNEEGYDENDYPDDNNEKNDDY